MSIRLSSAASYTIACTLAILVSPLLMAQTEKPLSSMILTWSEAEQVAWLNAYLAAGMPVDSAAGILISGKSSLCLPILENKIEQILGSQVPGSLLKDNTKNPERVVEFASLDIAFVGDEQALREIAKLMKLDEPRFGRLVAPILDRADTAANPYTVAYVGLEIGDPAVDQRIMSWIEGRLENKKENLRSKTYRLWAEALVQRYQRAPTKMEMANDPIAHRLPPAKFAALEAEMERFTAEAAQRRPKPQ